MLRVLVNPSTTQAEFAAGVARLPRELRELLADMDEEAPAVGHPRVPRGLVLVEIPSGFRF